MAHSTTAAEQFMAQLQITLPEIAQLARVRRPVVSMWRSRSLQTDRPFPGPVGTHGRQELFNALQVTAWLEETGHGNNPLASADVAAFASPLGPDTRTARFVELTALLTLRCLSDAPLSLQGPEDILDLADEIDPDDDCLFREVESLGEQLPALAAYADLLADASYSAAAALEHLVREHFRSAAAPNSKAELTPDLLDLLASTAIELSAGSENPPVFRDDGGSEILPAVADAVGELRDVVLQPSSSNSEPARLTRRRLLVRGRTHDNLAVALHEPRQNLACRVRVAQFPSPCQPATEVGEVLTAIDDIALDMSEGSIAVILAPAWMLTGQLPASAVGRRADAIRSDVLRSGQVRAIVTLPDNLLPAMPRQPQSLWVLGPAWGNVPIAERWTLVADLSATELSLDVRLDLVSDLAASMGSREEIRAHSFRFAKLVPTRSLLAMPGSLTAAATTAIASGPAHSQRSAQAAARIAAEALVRDLRVHHGPPALPRLAPPSATALPVVTLGQAIRERSLKYVPGHRLDPAHFTDKYDAGARLRVIGAEDLQAEGNSPARGISQLVFARHYPNGHLTEPGDVIFSTGAQGGAMVDQTGGGVVLYPARILRIDSKNPRGLLAEVLAQDLRIPRLGKWRQWPARAVRAEAQAALKQALQELAAERQSLAVRLQRLDELAAALADGVSQGSFDVLDMTVEGA